MRNAGPVLSLQQVTLGYAGRTIQRHLSFDVGRGSIFAIMGASGSGKSTLLQSMIGLLKPESGRMTFAGQDYWSADAEQRADIGRRFGVLFQGGALWSALTVGENVALPMQMFTPMEESTIRRLVEVKLALVGLEHAIDLLPSELSGGMAKRAGLARALALDPEVLFLDEPSSGLDPVAARRLDDLILDLREATNATVVLVSHDLLSLFAVADDGVFLDAEAGTAIACGSAMELRDHSKDPRVLAFMRREAPATPAAHIEAPLTAKEELP
ncbi:MAG TPA: ATP-binding cassette domain-containing protein [Steroidobacteraceae bacterium]|jgi:phospholipid/cholesterol/gamma-HCH transport system ATP-binding protein|nr:ATP-binding cassette domain-containing protein [Steroidobacteraceae bacterium]